MSGEAPAPGQAAREALRQAFREHSGGCPGQECADCDRLDAEFMTLADAYALAAQETAQSAVSALQRLADKTPMGNWDEPEPAEVALRRDYAQAALDALAIAAQERPAPGTPQHLRAQLAIAQGALRDIAMGGVVTDGKMQPLRDPSVHADQALVAIAAAPETAGERPAPELAAARDASDIEVAAIIAERNQLRMALQQVAKHIDSEHAQLRIVARIAKRALEGK